MTDETYTLVKTNLERKVTARSANRRVSGSKSRRCTLPSDHLTQAQRDALSGPVTTYTMDERHTWAELRRWPDDLRRQYMDKLLSLSPSNAQLGEFLCYSPGRIWDPLQQCGIHRGKGGIRTKQTEDQKAQWDAIRGALPEPEPMPDPVITYAMDERHTWYELKHWPEDLRRQYMNRLLELNPSNEQLGDLLSYSPGGLWAPLRQCGIRRGVGGPKVKQTAEQKAQWDAIRGARPHQPEPEPEPTPDPVLPKTQPSMISSLTLDLPSVTMAEALAQLIHDPLLQHLTDTYHVHITIERRSCE